MKAKRLTLFLILIVLLSPSFIIASETGSEEPTVSALYFEFDLREALNDLMLQSGVNIIFDDTVNGLVNVDLQNVPLERALKMVLLSGGYSYRKMDGYYLVGMPDPRSPVFRKMAETSQIKLKYISASEARSLLPAFYDSFISSSNARDIITISATPEIINDLKKELEKIDTPPKQIKIQAVIAEVSTDVIEEYGADFLSFLTEGSEEGVSLTLDNGEISLNWQGVYSQIMTNLKALEREEKVEIKANPQIVVTDRGTGSLFIGEEQIIILEPEGSSARLEEVKVGVSLKVSPKIVGEEEIELTLSPEMSHFTEEMNSGLRIRKSSLATTVYTKNGETLVMAGMTIKDQSSDKRKVPILGDIPIVRWFFSQSEKQDGERELFIFLTPEIVSQTS